MNDVWFEIDKERYLAAKPQFNRILFFPDYMITNTETNPQRTDWQNNADYINYKDGKYDFNSAEMKILYKYLDLIKSYGGKYYINFGFGVSSRIAPWYSIVSGDIGSAPREVDLYAKACAALLKELKNRGYGNELLGVSFYNEPNGGGFKLADGENTTKAQKIVYYNNIIDAVHSELNAQKLNVDILAAEISNVMTNDKFGNYTFLKETAGNSKVSAATFHMYYWTIYGDKYGIDAPVNANYIKNLAETAGAVLKKPMYLTEFNTGNYDYGKGSAEESSGGLWTWDTSNASLFITSANSGIMGAARWNYASSYWTDPFNFLTDPVNNYESLWLNATSAKNVEYGVLDKFYEESLLTNYVKAGSEVLGSAASNSDGTRIAAFRLPDGNYTVVVEVKEGGSRNLSISFDKAINKKFYRMSFNHKVANNGNATVRSCEKVFENVGDRIFDSVSGDYAYYVYTTCTPIKQIELNKVTATVEAGKSIEFTPSFVDCSEDDEELVWEVSACTGSYPGNVSNGIYTASGNAKKGDLVAVKASLASDPLTYAVAVIEIK